MIDVGTGCNPLVALRVVASLLTEWGKTEMYSIPVTEVIRKSQ